MRVSRLLLLALAALALATAGCLGGGGDGGTAADTDPADGTGPGASANATGPGPAGNDTTEEPEGPWWNVTYTNATVEGTNAIVSFGPPLGEPNQHFFNVTRGAHNLTLNFTAQDGELYVTIYEPNCDEGSDALQDSDCSHRADTGGLYYRAMGSEENPGESSWSTEDPPSGMWRIQIYKGDTGTGAVDYTVEHAILQPREG